MAWRNAQVTEGDYFLKLRTDDLKSRHMSPDVVCSSLLRYGRYLPEPIIVANERPSVP